MLTYSKRHDIGYYLATDTAGGTSGALEYFARDNGTAAGLGHWWCPSPVALLTNGSVARPEDVAMLAAGRLPPAGRRLVQTQRKDRIVAFDFTLHTAKHFSVLYACAPENERRRLLDLHQNAVRSVMDTAWRMGLIVTRRGHEGLSSERPAHVFAAMYDHVTNRAADPFLHGHSVLLNACLRADGTSGTIDPSAMLSYQGYLGMIYAAAVAYGLQDLGYAVERDGDSFRILGISEDACAIFSKRRAEIEEYAYRCRFDTRSERGRAQIAALTTRGGKLKLSPAELQARWDADLARVGCTAGGLYRAARSAGATHGPRRQVDDEALFPAYVAAIDDALETDVCVGHPQLCRLIARTAQTLEHPEAVDRRIKQLIERGVIIEIGQEGGRPVYSTPQAMATERQLLRDADAMRGAWPGIDEATIERTLAAAEQLSDEQARAVRYALGKDGVTIVEGSAGSGKSTLLGPVVRALESAGYAVQVTAPSWKATHGVRTDTGLQEAFARAVQGFAKKLREGRQQLTSRSVIIVDEAGMVGTDDLAVIVTAARRVGAKVILSGDTRQLQPVSRGAPMSLLARRLGTCRVAEIRRQRALWQRQASHALATGHADEALEEYDRHQRIVWADDADDAMDRLVEDWSGDLKRHPKDSRLVLASRNRDVHRLNRLLRDAWQHAGRLNEPEVTLPAVMRGGPNGQGYRGTVTLAVGDRVVMGERIEAAGATLYTSDVAVVEAIDARDPQDPVVTLRIEGRDVVVSERWSQLVGTREAQDDDPDPPKIQHAFAMTVHMAQGQTVERSYLYAGARLGAESTYVGLTRHRGDTKRYVSTRMRQAGLEFKLGQPA